MSLGVGRARASTAPSPTLGGGGTRAGPQAPRRFVPSQPKSAGGARNGGGNKNGTVGSSSTCYAPVDAAVLGGADSVEPTPVAQSMSGGVSHADPTARTHSIRPVGSGLSEPRLPA